MKYAIISDIHGNLPALEAVLADAAKNGVDSYIFAGDIMSDLPWVNEAAEAVRNLPRVYAVAGNRDELPKKFGRNAEPLTGVDQVSVLYRTIRGLTPENFRLLSNLPKSAYIPLPYHGRVYATHWVSKMFGREKRFWASSGVFREVMEARPFTRAQMLEQSARALGSADIKDAMREALAGIDASAVVFGHSHIQWHGRFEGKLLINPGSCGLPLDWDPRAAYTVLEDSEAGLSINERRVAYDVEETVRRAGASAIYGGGGGRIWRDLVFICLRENKEVIMQFFALAWEIARGKGESGEFYSNRTWRE
ncbi:MAG: metallophosphoesterase family protein, partial [Firmicutes bacterium]|nr:metallophosphoesterase family protein [Bacillota bacterium]